MATVPEIFGEMPSRYRTGAFPAPRTYYFSIGPHKYTVWFTSEACRVESGRQVDDADCVLKTTPDLFERIVLHGKVPGPIDIARGRFKTNSPALLQDLRGAFQFPA